MAEPQVTFLEVAPPRGRPFFVADRLWRLPIKAAFAEVVLPLGLNWSRPGKAFAVGDRRQRARCYEVVLREGMPADLLRLRRWRPSDRPLGRAGSSTRAPSSVAAHHRRGDRMSGLTPFQEEVARLFFSLPASDGFLLAGAARCSPPGSRPGPPRIWTSRARTAVRSDVSSIERRRSTSGSPRRPRRDDADAHSLHRRRTPDRPNRSCSRALLLRRLGRLSRERALSLRPNQPLRRGFARFAGSLGCGHRSTSGGRGGT